MIQEKPRIALVVSHPIQHFCPQYVSFGGHGDVVFKVFFASALGQKKYYDENFKKEISWGNLQLDKFDHLFLNGAEVLPSDKHIDAVTLNKELSAFAPDLVITYGYFQKLQRRARAWALENNIKVAYISDSELRHSRNPVKDVVKGFFIKKYFSRIDYFLSVGNANEAFYKKYGVAESRIKRMHFPIDISLYEQCWKERDLLRKKIRTTNGIEDDAIVLSVVGKLVAWKNQDHIIDAMLKLEAEGLTTHLLMVGSGEMLEDWQEKARVLKKSKVVFAGFVNIEELPAWYAATDIYVHPASLEPHSIAVSEAIYMGCPVILADTCGSYGETDDVQPGRNGLVYPFGDLAALAKHIATLSNNPKQRIEFGTRSHLHAVGFQRQSHAGILNELITAFNA